MKPVQTYHTADITVTFDPNICIHSAVCLKSLPAVFDIKRSPWIHVDAASADQIMATIEQCPSGALQYELAEGGAVENNGVVQQTEPSTTIRLTQNGPLMVKGQFVVINEDGASLETPQMVALCRCGATATPPFCDGSHQKIGFKPGS